MVLICDSCSQRPAICYCFVDEAFLCTKCDASIHSANVLASKHDRVPLYDADKVLPSERKKERKRKRNQSCKILVFLTATYHCTINIAIAVAVLERSRRLQRKS